MTNKMKLLEIARGCTYVGSIIITDLRVKQVVLFPGYIGVRSEFE